jgi:hypothetical protein
VVYVENSLKTVDRKENTLMPTASDSIKTIAEVMNQTAGSRGKLLG